MSAVSVEQFTDVDRFIAAIEPAVPRSDAGFRYFHHPAWARHVWEQIERPRGSRLHLLVVHANRTPVGWWPLVLSRRSVGYRLQNLGQEISDYAIPYVAQGLPPGQRAATADALLAGALQAPRAFSFAQFRHMLAEPWESAGDPAAWLSKACAQGWQVGPPDENRWIDFQEYGRDPGVYARQRLSMKFRKNLRHEANVLARRGAVELVALSDGTALSRERDRYLSWYRYGGEDSGKRARKLAIWWSLFSECLGSILDASALRVDGVTVSLLIGFRRAAHYDLFSLVFDPQFLKLSVGKQHLYQVIERELRAGTAGFHFLTGDDEYKKYWANAAYPSWDVRFNHRGNLPALLQWLKQSLRQDREAA